MWSTITTVVAAVVLAGVSDVARVKFVIEDLVMPGNTAADNLNMKVLRNSETNESVKVIHDFGGRLEEVVLMSKSRNKLKSVIATHNNNASAVRANIHWAGAMLAPFANRIANGTYTFEGVTYYLPRNEVRCNGTCDNALHGFLWNKTMNIVSTNATTDSATLVLAYTFSDEPGYPFQLEMTITYKLSARGLEINVQAFNPSKSQALPFFHSVHPYFVADDVSKVILEFDACTGWNHMDMGPGYV